MRGVFADTSFFAAFLNPRDANYSRAITLMAELQQPIVTSEWVLAELGSSMSRGYNRTLYSDFIVQLRAQPAVKIVPADSSTFERGLSLFNQRQDKEWSLIDCMSILLMTDMKIDDALTADHHFVQAGFRALMA